MNVRKCKNGQKGIMHCAFKMRRRDPQTGKVLDYGCIRQTVGFENSAGVDHYNIYPEHDESSGDVVYQQQGGEASCFRVGPQLIWENINGGGQNGLNYDLRKFSADIHPCYRREDRNLPSQSQMSEEDIGEIFGGSNPVLVSKGWMDEKWIGMSNVEVCNEGIYGVYNSEANMVMPKCFKDYSRDIFGWENYTTKAKWSKKREFYLSEMNDEQVHTFCKDLFKNEKIAERMANAMLYIQKGNFLNIWVLMTNNFIPHSTKRKFMDSISLRTKKELYKGTINLKLFCDMYSLIDSMRHKEDGEIKKMDKQLRVLYKGNLVNYILNYPELQTCLKEVDRSPTNKRYWFVIQMLKKAKKEGILNTSKALPDWLVKLILEKNDPEIKYLGESYKYSTAPKDVQKEYDEAVILNIEGPHSLYPAMMQIKNLLDTKDVELGWFTFCDILDAGRLWNMAEIRLAWDHFKNAWIQETPEDFWNWIEMVADLPYETEISVSQEEHNELLHRRDGKKIADPKIEEVISHGACDFNLGEGRLSPARAFAMNLIQQLYDYESWDVQKQPLNNSFDAIAKVKKFRECTHETFWSSLARLGGLSNDQKEIKKVLSDSSYEEIMQNVIAGVSNLDSTSEVGLSDSDLYMHDSMDPLTGEHNHLNGGVGSWSDED